MATEDDSKVSTYETYVSSPSERTVLLVKAKSDDTWQEKIGLFEPTELNFWREVLAEFLLTLIFTMFACGCTLNLGVPRPEVHQALCVGFLVCMLTSIASEKFGFVNPAISFGLFVARRISFVRLFVYVAVQLAGSVAGAGLLYFYTPEQSRGHLGTLSIHEGISPGVGFVIELTLTFVVMMVVITTTDKSKNNIIVTYPIVIGSSVVSCLLFAMPYTGAGLNPIRAFGPAAITGNLNGDEWVYWIGPIIGAALASLSYEFVFKPSSKPVEPKPRNDMPTVQLHIKNSNV